MTDYAAMVTALKEQLGTWQAVANACNTQGHDYTPAYYWRVDNGDIKTPGRKARLGIAAAVVAALGGDVTGLKSPQERAPRGGLACGRSLWERLRDFKIRMSWTWDELLERALGLLIERYG